ncbi:MAG: MotA/TolQ/ExbB proton channel family protein [Candidatus Krumholzibacteria bacterium]|nr:MotA/TolQ/ExbB proton channel family protein [Candidatus Krumholzibacteria bacterium]
MMKRALTLMLLLLIALPALAQDSGQSEAQNLDDLLKQVQDGSASDKALHRQRETDFRAAKDQQAQLLADAKKQLRAAEKRSEDLETTYNNNDLRIIEVTEQLDRRLGSMKELFGVMQQVTGDTKGQLDNSLTSAQFPDRGVFLMQLNSKLASDSALPSISEIEQLWFLLQQEMTETGKVVKFPAKVIAADGQEKQEDVVRIGGFNLVSQAGYLQYTPETGNLSELSRQPQGRFTKTAAELVNATSGSVVFGVDPTRGQILATYLDRPSLVERVAQGGLVGYVIIGLGVIGLLLALERLISLTLIGSKVSAQLKSDTPSASNPLGRILLVAEKQDTANVETLELKLGEAIFREMPKLTRSLLFIKIISVVAPLLGLLGTVTGMIVTFQAITLFGTGDPKLMAGGISQALVTTVLGLTVAIPIVLLHTLVSGRSKGILHVLQEQSAGIVATRSGQGS